MKTKLWLTLFFAVSASPVVAAETRSTGVADLAWISGCWKMSIDTTEIVERWTEPAGGIMMGISITCREGKAVEYEFMRIHTNQTGQVLYTAIPSGQKETSFELVRLDGREAVFENPRHDFPQRVVYKRSVDSRLDIRIERLDGAASESVEFPMTKEACE